MNKRISGIDPLRGMAALAIFGCHISQYWLAATPTPKIVTNILANAGHSVDLFLVISGTCLALPLVGRPGRFDRSVFLKRRAFRLLPPYYIALALASALALSTVTWRLVVAQRASAFDVVVHALFLQAAVPGRSGTINGSLWTVAMEVQLYLCFPALLWLRKRWSINRLLVTTAALSIAWRLLAQLHAPGTLGSQWLFPARLVQFVAGMWVAEQLVGARTVSKASLRAVLVISATVGLVVSTLRIDSLDAVAWTVPAACLILLVSDVNESRGITKWLGGVGAISFSYYLLHQPIELLAQPLAHRLTSGWAGLLGLGGVLSLLALVPARIFYHVVELPSQKRSRLVGEQGRLSGARTTIDA